MCYAKNAGPDQAAGGKLSHGSHDPEQLPVNAWIPL